LKKTLKIAKMGRRILGWWKLKDLEEIFGKLLSINIESKIDGLNEIERIGLKTYHPKWFVKYCYRLLGRSEALRFLEKSEKITPTYLRLNTLKMQKKMLLKNIAKEKIMIKKVPKLKNSYKLIETKIPLSRTKSYDKGLFFIQDKASCLAAEIANPKPGNTVIDVCAAPGSKTTYLAQIMKNKGSIISIDYSKRRIGVLQNELNRMGVKIVQTILAEVRTKLPLNIKGDLVILDPPCTSTGTFGKTPAAKWRLTNRSIYSMSKIQNEMIEICSNYVKSNGFFVYSTCSVTLEENEMILEKFLKLHSDFKLIDSNPRIGLPGLRGLTQCQRLYPHIHDCNGFFVAKLHKMN
jgi:16S rRNA (cytosine967-C5)-methyltransferase